MPATVKLKEIVDALDEQFDESTYFVNLDTGELELVSKDLLREAEEFGDEDEEPDLPAWQEPQWELAKRIFSTGRFQHLPSKFDVHEWSIMQDFALSIEPGEIRDDLLDAIHGAGAFRNFNMPFEFTVSNRTGLNSAPTPCGRSRSTGAKGTTSPGSRQAR